MSELNTPFSDAELEELDSFLLSEACDDETLSVDEAHGFLTALVAAPLEVAPEEWARAIWGEPRFADTAQERRMNDLLQRLHNDIATTLQQGLPFEPLVVEVEEQGEVFEAYEGWCFGFMLGVSHNQDLWALLPKDEQALVAPMAQLALLESEEEEEPEMDEEEYSSWIELLPGAVVGLYSFWHSARGQEALAAGEGNALH